MLKQKRFLVISAAAVLIVAVCAAVLFGGNHNHDSRDELPFGEKNSDDSLFGVKGVETGENSYTDVTPVTDTTEATVSVTFAPPEGVTPSVDLL